MFDDLIKASPPQAQTRIVNKTNGITFRRWLYEANPILTQLLVERLGERVLDDPDCLKELEKFAGDENFVARYEYARTANKSKLAGLLLAKTRIAIDPHAMFDVQIKRVHEYKRQLLNLLETIALYQEIKSRPHDTFVPRVKIFAGKAAASYERAKLIIKLAGDIGKVVNNDPVIAGRLKLVFIPNYSASLAESIIPAADLSEQISTAGMEASGTGNMKLALNGAITIGTMDGANIEICEQVGRENVVIFGMTAQEVAERVAGGLYRRRCRRDLAALAPRAGKSGRRRILAGASRPLCLARRCRARLRPLHGGGRFRLLLGRAARGRQALADARRLVARQHSQHRAHGLVLVRPHHPRIRPRHLERPAALITCRGRSARKPAPRA